MPQQLPVTTADRWQTSHIVMAGGITDNTDELSSAAANPGALTVAINYEPGLKGGYRRINGYTQFGGGIMPGTGTALGVKVFTDEGVVSARNNHIYFSAGSGWTQLDTTSPGSFTASINSASFTGLVNSATFTAAIFITGFTASIASGTPNILTVSAMTNAGTILVGSTVAGTGVTGSPVIVGQLSGIPGGVGAYQISGAPLTVASEAMTTTGNILSVTAVATGNLVVGGVVKGAGVTGSPAISSQLTGTASLTGTYLLTGATLSIASEAMSASGTTLNVTAMTAGSIIIGDILAGTGITGAPTLVSQISGTPGGIGLYTISLFENVGSEALTTSSMGTTLTISALASGTVAIGATLFGTGVTGSPTIASQISGTPNGIGAYTITGPGLTIASEAMTSAFAARTTPSKVRFSEFNYGFEKIIGVDGVNTPFTWDGTTYALLPTAPKGNIALSFGNSMFIANGEFLSFSAPENENDWDASDGAGIINVGFIITGLRAWRGTLYIFGETHISSLTGTVFGGAAPDAVFASVATNVGCVATDSIVEISGDVLYLSADGIRTVSGTTRIGDIELAAITDPVHDKFIAFIQQYAFANFSACSVRSKNQYRLFAANSGTNTTVSQGWLIGIRGTSYSYTGVTNNWEHYQLQGINAYCADSGYVNGTEVVVHGSFDGSVYRQEEGNSFNGGAIFHQMQLSYNGFDDPELRKSFYKIKSNILSEGIANFTVQMSFDFGTNTTNTPLPFAIATTNNSSSNYGTGIYGTSVYNSASNPDFFNYAIGSGLNMSLIYSGNDATSASFTIRSVVLDYQINGRR